MRSGYNRERSDRCSEERWGLGNPEGAGRGCLAVHSVAVGGIGFAGDSGLKHLAVGQRNLVDRRCTIYVNIVILLSSREKSLLVTGMTLRVARIIGAILAALLAMLEAAVLWRAIRVRPLRSVVARWRITVLWRRCRRWITVLAISWLTVSLRLVVMTWRGVSRPSWRRRSVVWRVLVVWIRHADDFWEREGSIQGVWSIDAVMGTRLYVDWREDNDEVPAVSSLLSACSYPTPRSSVGPRHLQRRSILSPSAFSIL